MVSDAQRGVYGRRPHVTRFRILTCGFSRWRTLLAATVAITVVGHAAAAQAPLDTVTTATLNTANFDRYTPSQCGQSASWTEGQFWRTERPDTVPNKLDGNPLQPVTVAAVRACLARFSLATLPVRDLLGAAQAYLAAEEPTRADSALTRYVTSSSAANRAWTLYEAARIDLEAQQPRLEAADVYVRRLDSLGASAVLQRMLAHYQIAGVAQQRDDVPRQAHEIDAAMKASKEITGDLRRDYAAEILMVYIRMADIEARQNDVAGVNATLRTARVSIATLRQNLMYYLEGSLRRYAMLGKHAAPLQATAWANTGTTGTARPLAGVPSVVIFLTEGANCGGRCYAAYAALRRLAAEYAPKGIDFTAVVRTQGYYKNELVNPDSETALLKRYFTTTIHLPVALGIWHTVTGHRDDGRLTVESAPNEANYHPPGAQLPAFLIDKTGTIRMVTTISPTNEAIIRGILQSMLN